MSADEEYNPLAHLAGLVPATGWARRRREPRQDRRWGRAKWHRVVKAVSRMRKAEPRTVETLCGRALTYVEMIEDRPHENRFCAECMARWTKEGTDAAGVA